MNINSDSASIDSNDLDDIELPSLDGDAIFDYYFNITNNVSYEISQSGTIFNNYSYNTDRDVIEEKVDISHVMNVESEETQNYAEKNNLEESESSKLVICCFCQKKSIKRNMFIFESEKYELKDNLICLKCSSNISNIKMLKDWEKMPNSTITRVCKRCNREKSDYRFNKKNKYCDNCLLKKKWSRLRSKIEFENTNCDYSEEDDNYDDLSSASKCKNYVVCCFCNERVRIHECFKFFESCDDLYSSKHICLNCSINIKDWRCLRDWEDETEMKKGRLCSRCKKRKSSNRFKAGKSGCEYCSLKRKRMYLMKRK